MNALGEQLWSSKPEAVSTPGDVDWLTVWMEYTDGLPTPMIYRLWSGISAISGALERRVWSYTSMSQLYPNLFTLLVGPPAVGKSQAIGPVQDFWQKAEKLTLAPDSVTGASLIDALGKASKKHIISAQEMLEFHHLLVSSGEFGVLVSSYDLGFLSILNKIYDCPDTHRETRRTGNRDTDIYKPGLTILAGTQPGFMASLLPEEAWSMGFTSRLTMIYSANPVKVPLFGARRDNKHLIPWLAQKLRSMTELMGEFTWSDEAKRLIQKWLDDGLPPVPTHSKLQHYNGRRIITVIKLTMIAAISSRRALIIEPQDFIRARDWLLEAEVFMPDIFRDMVHRSDNDVIQELHIFIWKLYQSTGKQGVHESRLVHFLQSKLPSEKIIRLLEIAERSKTIIRMEGTSLFMPGHPEDISTLE